MSHASEHQSEAGNIANKAKLARQKEIADSIPVSKEGLFAFEINWAVSEAHGIAEKIMRPWIIKKIKEYLGEEETVLINFIVTKLSNPCVPDDLLTELTPVLDVDAEPFVLKLWRMFVFSVLKAADQ
jgi:RNA-binding protein 25